MIDRRGALAGLLAAGLVSVARAAPLKASRAVYDRALVVDTLSFDRASFDPAPLIAAGMTALVLDLFAFPRTYETATAELKAWAQVFAAPSSRFVPIRRAADFAVAKRSGRLGILLNSQDSNILGLPYYALSDGNLQALKSLYDLGLRMLQLTYTDANGLGSGYAEPGEGGPITRLGEAVVHDMNALGMVIDTSHCGERTTLDAITRSTKPVVISHAGCRAVYDNPRNKTDALIRRLADKGGYFGVFNATLWMTDQATSSVETIVDHIDHVVKVGGIDLVGFGSDQIAPGDPRPQADKVETMRQAVLRNRGWPDTGPTKHTTASDLDTPTRCQVLADALSRRGYKDAAVEKILGANFIRVFGEICG